DLGEEIAHVLEEERAGLGIALLVAEAGAQEQRALGPRGGHIEEVALAVELVLTHAQHESGGAGDRAAIVVREERLGHAPARELALLEAADEDGVEAAGSDPFGSGYEHAVRLGTLPEAQRPRSGRPPPGPSTRASPPGPGCAACRVRAGRRAGRSRRRAAWRNAAAPARRGPGRSGGTAAAAPARTGCHRRRTPARPRRRIRSGRGTPPPRRPAGCPRD